MSVVSVYSVPPGTRAITEAVRQLLYTTNPHVQAHFRKTQKAVPPHLVEADSRIRQLLINNEPGPRVDHDNLRANLIELAPFVVCTENGLELFSFFKTLRKASEAWLKAAVNYHSYLAYFDHLSEYLADGPGNDEDFDEWIAWGNLRTQYYGTNDADGGPDGVAKPDKAIRVENTMKKVAKALKEKTEGLEKIKKSDDMWRWSNTLWCGIQKYDAFLWKKEVATRMAG